MKRKMEPGLWVFRLGIIMLFFVLVTFRQLGTTYARYASSASGTDGAHVALFGESETITLFHDTSTKFYPGVSGDSKITVTNQTSDNRVSEVSQHYSIEVETAGTLPLVFTLKDQNGKTIGTFTEKSSILNSDGEERHTFQTDQMTFQAGVEGSHTYELNMEWPKDKANPLLAGVPDFVNVNVKVEQTD